MPQPTAPPITQPLRMDPAWLDLVQEEVLEPTRPIVDPHHHLWKHGRLGPYLLADLRRDTGGCEGRGGHNVVKTVFVECHAEYHERGPEPLRPVGETEFVADVARASAAGPPGAAVIAGIVGHADLRLGAALDEVLRAHEAAGRGLFRGIRHAGACDPDPALSIAGRAPAGLYAEPDFRAGVKRLGAKGYTYDTWHYHPQNRDFAALARACPDTTLVLDHFGTPLGVGRYAGRREEIFEEWRRDVAEIAQCQNVVAKLGGLAMPDNGFGFEGREKPPSSDEFASVQRRYYLHMIDCFGPERCMFESNFPVDKLSLSYGVLWNGFKKIVRDFSEHEKTAMFSGTASRVYRI